MVICLERGADLHMAQLMPLPLTVSCFSKLQIGFTFLQYRLTWVVSEKSCYTGVCVNINIIISVIISVINITVDLEIAMMSAQWWS